MRRIIKGSEWKPEEDELYKIEILQIVLCSFFESQLIVENKTYELDIDIITDYHL